MARFQYNTQKSVNKNMLLSLATFVLIIGLFFYGINSVSARTDSEQRKSLENAISRGITHCYAVEGSYPESLSYLKEHYGITYDENKFFVDYKTSGSNIMPDVTIIEKGD